MKEKILRSLMIRQGMEDTTIVLDMVEDSIADMKNYLNYKDDEELPDGCIPAVKKLALVRYNQDGVEGIASESQSSGGSTNYLEKLPDDVKRTIRKYRRLPR